MPLAPDAEAAANVERALLDYSTPDFRGPFTLEPMPGGASTRKFFRVGAEGGRSLVAMYVPKPSQEITKARQATNSRPFVEVQMLLSSRQVSVPNIYRHFEDLNVLFVEDLGDLTLAEFLKLSPNAKESLYREAVTSLARAQVALAELPATSIVTERAFDRELLAWEIQHFEEYALTGRGIALDASERAVFAAAAELLSSRIAGLPRGFSHRDYQSRNLMLRKEAAEAFSEPGEHNKGARVLTWIDFQDAMLGPRVYDLVALLTDSYQTFTRTFVKERLTDYAEAAGTDLEKVLGEFDLVTVQRKLKDAGRFVFLDQVNSAPHFLKYVEPTIDKVIDALGRLEAIPELLELRQLLCRRLRPQL
jgi:N-acetylmuramate 1-kinase